MVVVVGGGRTGRGEGWRGEQQQPEGGTRAEVQRGALRVPPANLFTATQSPPTSALPHSRSLPSHPARHAPTTKAVQPVAFRFATQFSTKSR